MAPTKFSSCLATPTIFLNQAIFERKVSRRWQLSRLVGFGARTQNGLVQK
jgi:hypothetical protein